mmetsp:Transcript_48694/g.156441  ORF Transcript_48694/g.156441 Transcript_48694/m.156441 type:complete len:355 (-) Transcript_48694:66-1130(-)
MWPRSTAARSGAPWRTRTSTATSPGRTPCPRTPPSRSRASRPRRGCGWAPASGRSRRRCKRLVSAGTSSRSPRCSSCALTPRSATTTASVRWRSALAVATWPLLRRCWMPLLPLLPLPPRAAAAKAARRSRGSWARRRAPASRRCTWRPPRARARCSPRCWRGTPSWTPPACRARRRCCTRARMATPLRVSCSSPRARTPRRRRQTARHFCTSARDTGRPRSSHRSSRGGRTSRPRTATDGRRCTRPRTGAPAPWRPCSAPRRPWRRGRGTGRRLCTWRWRATSRPRRARCCFGGGQTRRPPTWMARARCMWLPDATTARPAASCCSTAHRPMPPTTPVDGQWTSRETRRCWAY